MCIEGEHGVRSPLHLVKSHQNNEVQTRFSLSYFGLSLTRWRTLMSNAEGRTKHLRDAVRESGGHSSQSLQLSKKQCLIILLLILISYLLLFSYIFYYNYCCCYLFLVTYFSYVHIIGIISNYLTPEHIRTVTY